MSLAGPYKGKYCDGNQKLIFEFTQPNVPRWKSQQQKNPKNSTEIKPSISSVHIKKSQLSNGTFNVWWRPFIARQSK